MQVKIQALHFYVKDVWYVFCYLSNFCLSKPGDASSHQRVYLKDLRMTKVIKGTDIQVYHTQFASTLEIDLANVIEF